MTEQKARKIIGKITLDRVSGEELEAINIAVKVLEKQIPKKAEEGDNEWNTCLFWICPNCNEVMFDKYDYCPYCGQKLDWGEEK